MHSHDVINDVMLHWLAGVFRFAVIFYTKVNVEFVGQKFPSVNMTQLHVHAHVVVFHMFGCRLTLWRNCRKGKKSSTGQFLQFVPQVLLNLNTKPI